MYCQLQWMGKISAFVFRNIHQRTIKNWAFVLISIQVWAGWEQQKHTFLFAAWFNA